MPPPRLPYHRALEWQRTALNNIYLLDTSGSSTFVTLSPEGKVISDPQKQDYQSLLPIALFAPAREKEAIDAVRTINSGTYESWPDDEIRNTILIPAREYLKKHRGKDAYELTAPEQKRIYQTFNAMQEIPAVASVLMERKYRTIIGSGITTGRVFRETYPMHALGTFDDTIPRTMFVSGMVFMPGLSLSSTVHEEMVHAFHFETLHNPAKPKYHLERFDHLQFDEQLEKFKKLKASLQTMTNKMLMRKPLSAQERKIEEAVQAVAAKAGVRTRDVLKDCMDAVTQTLEATHEVYQKLPNTGKMDELTSKAMLQAHELQSMYGNDMGFVFDMHGRLETYQVACHNLVVAEKHYEQRFSKLEREHAKMFGTEIYKVVEGHSIAL